MACDVTITATAKLVVIRTLCSGAACPSHAFTRARSSADASLTTTVTLLRSRLAMLGKSTQTVGAIQATILTIRGRGLSSITKQLRAQPCRREERGVPVQRPPFGYAMTRMTLVLSVLMSESSARKGEFVLVNKGGGQSFKTPPPPPHVAFCSPYQACMMYVITGGGVAPPRVLRASLRSRTVRASMRTFGLEALAALLRSLAPDGEVSTSRGAPSAIQVSKRGWGCNGVPAVL